MKCLSFLKSKRNPASGGLLLGAIVGSVLPGQAQQANADPSEQTLKSPVHLRLGATTVGKLAARIGEQTGLTIEAEAILSEHRILVQMDGISAEVALQTLAELNGWEIVHPGPGHYRIRPISVPAPKRITDVPGAFRMALPMDFRRYLDMEAEKQEAPPARPHGQFNDARQNYLQDKENQRQVTARYSQLLTMATEALTQDLPPALRDGQEHPYAALSEEQKDDMITLLVLNKLKLLSLDMLQGKLKPFQRDYTTAELTLKNGRTLTISSTTQANGGFLYEAFGAEVEAPKPPPAAKP
ncbi:MAG: hypothetical protein JWN14_3790 [Chthonomonadales bacterium]|nr:hypothetical protein [Chthonomonadales bacterium]